MSLFGVSLLLGRLCKKDEGKYLKTRKAMGLTDADLAEKPKPQRKPKAMGFSAFDLLEDDDDQTGSETEEKNLLVL